MRQLLRAYILSLAIAGAFFVTSQYARAGGQLAGRVLHDFLAAEQAGEMQLLGNCLETFNIEQSQIKQLIEAARETTSEERRNLLWQALRQTRSTAARDFLKIHLVDDCDQNSRVRYLRSLTNLAPFDVPLLTALFQGAEKPLPEKGSEPSVIKEDDLCDVLLQLATRETSTLAVAAPTWPEQYRDEKVAPPYMITARRTEQAKQAQGQLLVWIAKHTTVENHRHAAIQAAYKVLDSGVQPEFSRGLLAAAKSPEERARLYPLVLQSYGIDLVPLLVREDEPETGKLGVIQALHAHGSSYGYSISSIRHGEKTYDFVSKNDPSAKVRASAELLLKRLHSE